MMGINLKTAGLLLLSLCWGASTLAADASEKCEDCPIPVPANSASIERFTSDQFDKIAELICMRFDRYKNDPTAIEKNHISACRTPNEFVCTDEGEYLSMRGIVRSGINTILKIDSPAEFEAILPGAISELMTHSCDRSSVLKNIDVDFLKQRRNIAKRAIFLGGTRSFFDEFIFKEYSSVVNGKRKTQIAINAIEYVDGEPETLLDYLDKILLNGHIERLGASSRGNITALRNTLIFSYGAENAINLDCKLGQKLGCAVKTSRLGRSKCENRCTVDFGKKTAVSGDRSITYQDTRVDTNCFTQCAVYGNLIEPDPEWVKRWRVR